LKLDLDEQGWNSFDPDGMLAKIRAAPDIARKGWDNGQKAHLPRGYQDIENVIVAGMGGSAMGADILRAMLVDIAEIPMLLSRGYTIPAFAGPQTMVVCASYSGNTEETLSAFDAAKNAGCKIVVVGGGGRLFKAAENIPQLTIKASGMPRAVMVEAMFLLASLLDKMGVAKDLADDIPVAIADMDSFIKQVDVFVPVENNLAKATAEKLRGKIPMIVGSGALATVARRWKAQINENSDQWSIIDEMPEFNHNTIQGMDLPVLGQKGIAPLFLCCSDDDKRDRIQTDDAVRLMEEGGYSPLVLDAGGSNRLGNILCSVILGDFISYYLALLNDVNPTPIGRIARLKELRAQGD
tara:strand:+ start:2808 stop:3866 length:1059 start_codon:yes stop_codon:yes gene_type:complete